MKAERIGTGQVGLCVRFELQWESDTADGAAEDELPHSLVGKFAASDPESRAAGAAHQCYAREVGFYSKLKKRSKLRTPRCYAAQIAADAIDSVLILEDLRKAEAGDQLEGCTLQQARVAVEELAALHASWWGREELLRYDWISSSDDPAAARDLGAAFEEVSGPFCERFAGRLSQPVLDLVDHLRPVLHKPLNPGAAWTLVHRDFRCDNLLFEQPKGAVAPTVHTVDWQTLGRGTGASDLAYFLGGSLRTSIRRKHEQRFVQRYHAELQRLGVDDYGFDACWRDYQLGSLGGLVMAVTASMMVTSTPRGDEMFVSMARRHAAHALDLEVQSIVPRS
jgi:hypothetical protein